MTTLMSDHPPWRRLLAATASLPVLIALAVLAFAWPAARLAPRDVPVGIVGTGPAAAAAVAHLSASRPGGFDFHLYADPTAAERAIRARDVYGAFAITPASVTVLEASAASPAVAQLVTAAGEQLGSHAHAHVRTVDVVALSPDDPRGTVFASAMLPLTICGVIVAAAVAVLFRFRPAWRQLFALAVISAVAGLGVYLVVQGLLGALPQHAVATWAALALSIFAIGSATAGFVALLGVRGVGVAAVTMVLLGNPFSGVNSAPDLLPSGVDHLGQWLPPGAAANLLRSTAYFDGNGSGSHLAVLITWAVLGAAVIVVGHRSSARTGPDGRVSPLRDEIAARARCLDERAPVAG